ncbi:hypothetical protein M378DRAFT_19338 [Amanita muscaria Koide BX008]|uniref:Uncharacterized protein n=1 Tax=Amanita muscaria (strain Koide BX008) TaxID=946122 RepID=A0A0C2SJ75_AMAMK|nr:hypothetical protein M378DRAFT_19338 [Amanita muscaria Koide BX008]
MDLFIEFKFAATFDPFGDPENPLNPKKRDFRFEKDSDDARLVRGQLASYAAAHMGSQFRIIFSVYLYKLYGESMRDLFVGIVMVRSLPALQLYQLNSPISSLASFGVTNALIVIGGVTSLQHFVSSVTPEDIQQIQRLENRLRDDNPAHCEFRILMVPDRNEPEVEKQFYRIISSKVHGSPTVRMSHSTNVGL